MPDNITVKVLPSQQIKVSVRPAASRVNVNIVPRPLITVKVLPASPSIQVKVIPQPRITVKVSPAGAQGVQGPPGPAWVVNDIPTGAVNGSNNTFLATQDFDPDTIELLLNGQMLTQPDDFHTTGFRTVIIDRPLAPIVGDKIRLNFQEKT